MNSEGVIQFRDAVRGRDDASALSLLENDRVSINSVYLLEVDDVLPPVPILFLAIMSVRERVVRDLVRLGADIDSFRAGENGDYVSPAGDAIYQGNVPALALCVRLGANISLVYRTMDSPLKVRSGMDIAITQAKHITLIYLLDEVDTSRPCHLTLDEAVSLAIAAVDGISAKASYEILKSRSFNFKGLQEIEIFAPLAILI